MKFFQSGMLTKNKAFEFLLEWEKEDHFTFIGFDFALSFKGDHAGLRIYKRFWRFVFEFNFYDTRHWNSNENRFYRPGEEQAELKKRGYCFHGACDDDEEE